MSTSTPSWWRRSPPPVPGRPRSAQDEPGGLGTLGARPADPLTPRDQVVLEATTNAWTLYDQLAPLVREVKMAHPLLIKLMSSARVKTDTRDTLHLARLLAAGLLPEVWAPPPPVRELRIVVAHRQRPVRQRTQVRNRLPPDLHAHHLPPPEGRLC